MKLKILISVFALSLLFIACSDDDSPTVPKVVVPESNGSVTLSGVVTDTYPAVIGYMNNGTSLVVTLANEAGDRSIVLSSDVAATGTYNIPDKCTALFTDTKNAKMYEMKTGSIIIDEVSTTTITGSFNGSGYEQDLTTFQTDTTKVVSINGTFSIK